MELCITGPQYRQYVLDFAQVEFDEANSLAVLIFSQVEAQWPA